MRCSRLCLAASQLLKFVTGVLNCCFLFQVSHFPVQNFIFFSRIILLCPIWDHKLEMKLGLAWLYQDQPKQGA